MTLIYQKKPLALIPNRQKTAFLCKKFSLNRITLILLTSLSIGLYSSDSSANNPRVENIDDLFNSSQNSWLDEIQTIDIPAAPTPPKAEEKPAPSKTQQARPRSKATPKEQVQPKKPVQKPIIEAKKPSVDDTVPTKKQSSEPTDQTKLDPKNALSSTPTVGQTEEERAALILSGLNNRTATEKSSDSVQDTADKALLIKQNAELEVLRNEIADSNRVKQQQQSKIDELNKSLQASDGKIGALNASIEEAIAKAKAAETLNIENKNLIAKLQEEIKKANEALSLEKTSNKQLRTQLEQELALKSKKTEELQKAIDAAKLNQQKQVENITDFEAKTKELNNALTLAQDEAKQLQLKIDELVEDAKKSETEKQQAITQLNESLQKELQVAKALIAQKVKDNTQLDASLKSTLAQLKDAQANNEQQTVNIEELEDKIAQAEQALAKQSNEKNTLNDTLAQLKSDLKQAEDALANTKAEHAIALANLQKENQGQSNTIQKLTDKLAKLEALKASSEKLDNELNNKINNLTQELTKANEILSQQKAKSGNLETQIAEKVETINSLNQQLSKLQMAKEVNTKPLPEINQQIEALSKDLVSANEMLKLKNEQIKELNIKHSALIAAQNTDIDALKNKLEAELENAKNKLIQNAEEKVQLTNDLQNALNRAKDAESLVNKNKETITTLESQLQEYKAIAQSSDPQVLKELSATKALLSEKETENQTLKEQINSVEQNAKLNRQKTEEELSLLRELIAKNDDELKAIKLDRDEMIRVNAELKSKNTQNDLAPEFEKQTAKINALLSEIEQVKSEADKKITEYQNQLSAKTLESQKLAEKNSLDNKALAEAKGKLAALETQLKTLENDKTQNNSRLEKVKNDYEQKLQNALDEKNKLSIELSAIQKTLDVQKANQATTLANANENTEQLKDANEKIKSLEAQILSLSQSQTDAKTVSPQLKNITPSSDIEKQAYSTGVLLANNFKTDLQKQKQAGVELNSDIILAGLIDTIESSNQISIPEATKIITALKDDVNEVEKKALTRDIAYFKEFQDKKGSFALPNGNYFRILRPGKGGKPTIENTVTLYIKEFDLDLNIIFEGEKTAKVSELPKVFQDAVLQMAKGERWAMVGPAIKRYPLEKMPEGLFKDSALAYRLELKNIEK